MVARHTVKGLLGQPVIALNAGRRVGSIQEILFSAADNLVTAIILSKAPVSGSAKTVAADHIVLLGVDVALIDSDTSVGPLSDEGGERQHVRAATGVIRTQVITSEGRRLGEVSDIALDAHGNILGYHLSQNLIRNVMRGKSFIPVSAIRAVGEDAVLVDYQALQAVPPEPLPEEPAEAPEEAPSDIAEEQPEPETAGLDAEQPEGASPEEPES